MGATETEPESEPRTKTRTETVTEPEMETEQEPETAYPPNKKIHNQSPRQGGVRHPSPP